MNKVLSICIPTYNRCKYLRQCLDKVILESKKYHVCIYISDNCSDDETEQLVREKQKEYKYIFYKKQNINVGIDKNMIDVIKMSKSRYSWWLGDDDIVEDNSIGGLLQILNNDVEKSVVLLNASFISEDLQKKENYTTLNIEDNTIVKNPNEFLIKHWEHMPFSTLILNNRLLEKVDYKELIGTSHAYSGVVLEYLAYEYLKNENNYIYIIKKPLVFLRVCKKTWSDTAMHIYLVEIPKGFKALNTIYKKNSEIILKEYIEKNFSINNLNLYKQKDMLNIKFYMKIRNELNVWCRMKLITLIISPKGLINFYMLYILKQKLKKIFHNPSYQNIGIFCTGEHSQNMVYWYNEFFGKPKFKIYFFDNTKSKWGQEFFGEKIHNPQSINNYNLRKIIISTYSYQDEIYQNIKELGYKGEVYKIYKRGDDIMFKSINY